MKTYIAVLMLPRVCLSFAILFGLVAVAAATPTVAVGDWSAKANSGNLVIPLYVTGDDNLSGIVFIAEISATGYFPSLGSPTIVSIDLTSPGTVFATNHQAPATQFSIRATNSTVTNVAPAGGPNNWTPSSDAPIKTKESFLTQSGTVVGNGLLGTLVISTANTYGRVYDLQIRGMVTGGGGGSSSSFPGFTSILTNGTIDITEFGLPEPSTLALSLFALAGLAALAIRKKWMR